MHEPVVRFAGVTRRFGAVTAVDELSLVMQRGETVALLGPNGAGKTTAVEMLLGLVKPDAGDVGLFGGSPAVAVAHGRVGAMLQDAGLPQGVRVAELIGVIRGLYRDPLPVEDVLRLGGLEDVAGRQVQRLSGGQRQRVRLALALAGDPELVVLDEPTAALDVEARQAFWHRVHAAVAGGRTVLFATHRLEEADAVADRVVVLVGGRLVADGTPDDVKARAAGRSTVRFVADGAEMEVLERLPAVHEAVSRQGRWTLYTTDPDRTVRALLQQVPQAMGLEVSRAGMEEAFLSLVRQGGSP
jgi:ABC-2 type transport system ATP-binding protein